MAKKKIKNKEKIFIQVKKSQPLNIQSVCKYCGQGPNFYFQKSGKCFTTLNNIKNISINDNFISFKNSEIPPTCPTNCLDQMSYDLFFNTKFKGITVNNNLKKCKNIIIYECLTCECLRTVWSFVYKSYNNRPDIKQKQARDYFPRKFVY